LPAHKAPASACGDGTIIFAILVSVFSASLTISAVLASKIITVFGISVPAGVLGYCITFICTDVISEVWGKERARQVVASGFVALLCVLLLIRLALDWPSAAAWNDQQAFETVLGTAPRIIIGSLAAYLLSQLHDVWAFHFWKRATGGRHLWLRNNLSTAASQLLDSVVFITIAFAGVFPLLPLIAGQWAVKMGIAVLDTAVIYLLVWLIRDRRSPSPCGQG
jgi:hypothetical protein